MHQLERQILEKDKEIDLCYKALEEEKRAHLDEVDELKREN